MNKFSIVLLFAAAVLLSQTGLAGVLSGASVPQLLILVNFGFALVCLVLGATSVFGYVLYGRHLPEMPTNPQEVLEKDEDPESNLAQTTMRMRTASKLRPRFSWGMLALLVWALYHVAVVGILAYPNVWVQIRPAWLVF